MQHLIHTKEVISLTLKEYLPSDSFPFVSLETHARIDLCHWYITNPPHSQRKAKEAIFYDWLLPIHSALVSLHAWLPNALPQWLTGSLCGRASREAAPSVVLPVTDASWGSCWTCNRGVTNRNLGAKSLLTSVLSSRPPVIHPLFGTLFVSLGPYPKTFQGLHTQALVESVSVLWS